MTHFDYLEVYLDDDAGDCGAIPMVLSPSVKHVEALLEQVKKRLHIDSPGLKHHCGIKELELGVKWRVWVSSKGWQQAYTCTLKRFEDVPGVIENYGVHVERV